MKLTVIEDLKKAKPKRRAKILQDIHAKNVTYFKGRNPELGKALENLGTGDFEIRINDVFLDVIERISGSYCHPPGKLLEYIETVASWHHSGWIDKLEVLHRYTGSHEHGQLIHEMLEGIYKDLPQISNRMRSGIIQLPRLQDGRRFSGSTVFLGALTGLHIVQYLNTSVVKDVVIIEPDIKKFALSCWFLDYSAIERQFGRLVLHVGGDMPENPLNYLLGASPVTASVWMRLLPIYPSGGFDEIVGRINLRWRVQHEILVPFDREIRNLIYGATNLRDERPILCKQPTLSKGSRIAVVASGPSLDRDIQWLKSNRSRLIIISAHSTVRALRKNGIAPDFQCTLDTEMADDLDKLELDPDIPFIVYYKADPAVLKKFKTVLLVPENGKANAVHFHQPITHTHPTSGNISVSVALFLRPSEIYLLGLDLGFCESKKSHVSGSWHDDDEGAGHKDAEWRENIQAQSNFPESDGKIFTHAYYNQSRFAVEGGIESMGANIKIYNLSDGVRIKGAEARHSHDVLLEDYKAKKKDLKAIQAAFISGAEGVWSPYTVTGNAMLKGLKNNLLAAMRSKKPNWSELTSALDTAWPRVVRECLKPNPDDLRIEAYGKLIQDMLTDWYRVMVFTHTTAEFNIGYSSGLQQLEFLLDKLRWPPELDFNAGNLVDDAEMDASMKSVTTDGAINTKVK